MAITISVAMQKGGVGKTTTSQALASILGGRNNRVLMLDMDSQCNTTIVSGAEDSERTISDILGDYCTIQDAIQHLAYYDLICGDEYLANIEKMKGIEPTLLKDMLAAVQQDYDYIVIDTPPALGNLLQLSLMASDYVIIPTEARPLSLRGMDALQATIEDVQGLNRALKVLGILLIKYTDRTVLNRQIKDILKDKAEQLNTSVFKTYIREGIAVPESQTMQVNLIDYAPKSNPCIDYIAFTDEVISRIK